MNTITIDADGGTETISRHIYGHFSEHLGACIYGGYWVGEDSPIPNTRGIRNDVVEALRRIRIPNLRWPGGCFADEYHWADGIGPRQERPTMVNTHWGGVTEDNSFGTHEFLDLCGQLGCEPYICGNVGSGTVKEMSRWVQYVNFDGVSPMADLRRANGRDEPWGVRYWGVGNENWGCGGSMRPEYYADLYRRYACYCRDYGDAALYRIACGPNGDNWHWTEVMMREATWRMDGLALHYYCGSGADSNSATQFEQQDWFAQLKRALRMEELVAGHIKIMDEHDPEGKVALIVDEWGAWHAVEPGTNPRFLYQQNTLRDAMVASLTLDIFAGHCGRIHMANIAQTVNVLQAMILTEDEKMILTPTYHVFDMYKVHHGATALPIDLQCGTCAFGDDSIAALSATASRDAEGRVHVCLTNPDPNNEAEVSCEIRGAEVTGISGTILTAETITAHNAFGDGEADRVKPVEFDGAALDGGALTIAMPPKSIVALELS